MDQKTEKYLLKQLEDNMHNIKSYDEFKKKFKIPEHIKLYIIKGGYPDVQQYFENKKEWQENPYPDCIFYDFKWTLKRKDIPFGETYDKSKSNHFQNIKVLTQKHQFCQELNQNQQQSQYQLYFPRAYSLQTEIQKNLFIHDFKITKVVSLLKNYQNQYNSQNQQKIQICCRILQEEIQFLKLQQQQQNQYIQQQNQDIQQQNQDIQQQNQEIQQQNQDIKQQNLDIQQQKNLENQDKNQQKKNYKKQYIKTNNIIRKPLKNNTKQQQIIQNFNFINDKDWKILAEDELNIEDLKIKKHQQYIQKLGDKFNNNNNLKISKNKKNTQNKKINQNQIEKTIQIQNLEQKIQDVHQDPQFYQQLQQQIQELLIEYQKIKNNSASYQFDLNQQNIWIVKPGSSSRGRGIKCSSSLEEILSITKQFKIGDWVAQKYIENPLIMHKRKFDIRVWVLIQSVKPLQIWKYNDFYIRFSGQNYNANDLDKEFIHLTNNSVNKNCKIKSIGYENMYFQEQFEQYFKDNYNQNYEQILQNIYKQIDTAVLKSLKTCKSKIQYEKGQFEMLGYDFMIDQNFQTWLIEINASPDLSYSTQVTKQLIQQALPDIGNIILEKLDTDCDQVGNWVKIQKQKQKQK